MFNIVLLEPEIPQNTGNIGRTCVATGSRLHLIEPMGFRITEKGLKRAGMDYWQHLDVTIYDNLEDFLEKNNNPKIYYATTKGPQKYTLHDNKETAIRIPMNPEIRSLNLSNSVAIVLYEALRQTEFAGMQLEGHLRNFDWD